MTRPIIVVADAASGAALAVAKGLLERGCVVDMVSGCVPALGVLSMRQQSGCPANLVVTNAAMTDVDPLVFIQHLQKWQIAAPIVFYADVDLLAPERAEAIRHAGCRLVGWPIDAGRYDALAAAAASGNVAALDAPGGGHTAPTLMPPTLAPPSAPTARGTGSSSRASTFYNQDGTQAVAPMRTPLPGTLNDPSRAYRTPMPGTSSHVATPPSQAGMASRSVRRTSTGMAPPPAPPVPPTAAPPIAPAAQSGYTSQNRVRRSVEPTQPPAVAPRAVGSQQEITCTRCGCVMVATLQAAAYAARCPACGGVVTVPAA